MKFFGASMGILATFFMLAAASAEERGMWPPEFGDKVRDAGGRVDFVFGASRPFSQCHASTIVEVSSGELLAAWFGGTAEKDPDVGIWHARFEGERWSAPELLIKVDETAHWNPVLFEDEGVVYLFFKRGPEIPFWQTYWMQSEDGGRTWSEAVELVPGDEGGRGPVRSAPIRLADGAWLAGASTEHQAWRPFADRSDDKGQTWVRSEDFLDPEKLEGRGAIQPTVWESQPGHVHALLRTTAGRVWRTDSTDGGRTWAEAHETELPNNNSGFDVVYLPEQGRLLMVYNPVSGNWAARNPLDLAASDDNGETWKTIAHLEYDAGRSEFSYPQIVPMEGGVAISYTYQRERIRSWQVPLSVVTE